MTNARKRKVLIWIGAVLGGLLFQFFVWRSLQFVVFRSVESWDRLYPGSPYLEAYVIPIEEVRVMVAAVVGMVFGGLLMRVLTRRLT